MMLIQIIILNNKTWHKIKKMNNNQHLKMIKHKIQKKIIINKLKMKMNK